MGYLIDYLFLSPICSCPLSELVVKSLNVLLITLQEFCGNWITHEPEMVEKHFKSITVLKP